MQLTDDKINRKKDSESPNEDHGGGGGDGVMLCAWLGLGRFILFVLIY